LHRTSNQKNKFARAVANQIKINTNQRHGKQDIQQRARSMTSLNFALASAMGHPDGYLRRISDMLLENDYGNCSSG